MKKILLMLLIVILANSQICVSFAQVDSIEEKPGSRLILDGKLKNYIVTPICVNGKYMLPANELLVDLGIAKDKIFWNSKDNSIKVIKGTDTITLKVGAKVVYKNGKPIKVDATAAIYKGITYIPVSFVSVFGRVTYWDENTDTCLIAEQSVFSRVKQVIEKIDKSIVAVKKYKAVYHSYEYTNYSGSEEIWQEKTTLQEDVVNGKTYMALEDAHDFTERYFDDGMYYFKQSSEDSWFKAEEDGIYIKDFYGLSSLYEKSSIFYAGLTVSEDNKTNEIKLAGLSYNKNYLFNLIEGGIGELLLTDYYYEIVVDKKTYALKKVKFDVEGCNKTGDLWFDFIKKYEIDISDINGKFEVNAPEGIKDAIMMEG